MNALRVPYRTFGHLRVRRSCELGDVGRICDRSRVLYVAKVRAATLNFNNMVTLLRTLSNGFYTLAAPADPYPAAEGMVGYLEGTYIIVTDNAAGPLRDWLRTLGAQQVHLLQLGNQWATLGDTQLAEWLHKAEPFF